MSFWKWSRTASSNATADGTINWAEGMAPSAVNDSSRAVMAAAAKYRDDMAGAITTGGSSTAYTVTSYQVFDTLGHLGGQAIAFTPHTTNGATVTLNVDGLGAKPLRSAPSVELPEGVLVEGTAYVAVYNSSNEEFILRNFYDNPYAVPLGCMLPFTGTSSPNSRFVMPYGQAISRTTYATYFSMVGTTYGSGDGSTTFNVIDVRGRAIFGKDDMGGSAASRLSSVITGTTLGASGGDEKVALSTTHMASHTHDVTKSATAIQVAGSDQAVAPINTAAVVTGASGGSFNVYTSGVFGLLTMPAFTLTSDTGTGLGTAHNNMPPGIVTNVLLRVL